MKPKICSNGFHLPLQMQIFISNLSERSWGKYPICKGERIPVENQEKCFTFTHIAFHGGGCLTSKEWRSHVSQKDRFSYIPAEGVTHRHVLDKAVPEDEWKY